MFKAKIIFHNFSLLGFNIIHYYLAYSFIAMRCVAHIVLRGKYTKQLQYMKLA